METRSPGLIWLAITIPFAFVYPAVYGPQAALFSELSTRGSATVASRSSYQFSGIFASGLTPLLATELLRLDDKAPWYICAYVVAVCLVSALSVFAMREGFSRDNDARRSTFQAGGQPAFLRLRSCEAGA